MRPFSGNRTARQILTVMTGATLAQVIAVAVSPILGRLYHPADFGLYALYTSLVIILTVAASGKYEMAILLPEKDEEALNVTALALSVSAIFCGLVFLLAITLNPLWTRLWRYDNFGLWLALAPVNVWAGSATQSLSNWAIRTQQFQEVARSRVWAALSGALLSVVFGWIGWTSSGMIMAYLASQTLGLAVLAWLLKKRHYPLIGSISRVSMAAMARRYGRFPKFSVLSGFVENVAGQLPVLLMDRFFGPVTVGYYALGQRVVRMPMALISSAIGEVFRQKASAAYARDKHCRPIFAATARILFLASILPFIALFLFAPDVISLVFGANWRAAGEYLRLMSFMFFLQFTASPLSSMFTIAEKQHWDLVIQLILVASVAAAISAGYYVFGSADKAILLFAGVYSAKYIVEYFLSCRFSKGAGLGMKAAPVLA